MTCDTAALLQQKGDLTIDQIVAFVDLFEHTTAKADTYMTVISDEALGSKAIGGTQIS